MEQEIIDPPYNSRVYKALQDNVSDFRITEAEFNQKLLDSAYQKNVYRALKDNVQGFALSEPDFYSRVIVKKKDKTQPGLQPTSTGSGNSGHATVSGIEGGAIPDNIDILRNANKDSEQRRLETEVKQQEQAQIREELIAGGDYKTPQEQSDRIDPMINIGKTAWNLFRYQIPSAFASFTSVGNKLAAGRSLNPEYKAEMIKYQKSALETAKKLKSEGSKLTENTVNSIDKVNDPWDLFNWGLNAAAQAGVQIPLSVGTGGTSSLVQEVGSIYLNSVQRIAKEKGISADEVIDQGLDEGGAAMAFGAAAALLDRFGAGKVMSSTTKQAFRQSLKERAKNIIAAGVVVEGPTEYTQSWLEQLGAETGDKSFTETLKKVAGNESYRKERIESWLQGIVGGSAGAGIMNGAESDISVEPDKSSGNIRLQADKSAQQSESITSTEAVQEQPVFTEPEQGQKVNENALVEESRAQHDLDIQKFVQRMVNGEVTKSTEDLQFYENNKEVIESELQRIQNEQSDRPDVSIQDQREASNDSGAQPSVTETQSEKPDGSGVVQQINKGKTKRPNGFLNAVRKYNDISDVSPRVAVLKFFATGGRISQDQAIDRTGYKSKDLFGWTSKKGIGYDALIEKIREQTGDQDFDEADLRNEIDGVISGSKKSVFEELKSYIADGDFAEVQQEFDLDPEGRQADEWFDSLNDDEKQQRYEENEQAFSEGLVEETDTRPEEQGSDRSEDSGGSAVTTAQAEVDQSKANLKALQNEYANLSSKLAQNLNENQADMFGRNKTQSMFDDRAGQQALVTKKKKEVDAAKEAVKKAEEKLVREKDKVGQLTIEEPLSTKSDKLINDLESIVKSTTPQTPQKGVNVTAQVQSNPLFYAREAWKYFNKAQQDIIGKLIVRPLENSVAKLTNKGLESRYKALRSAVSTLKNLMGGLAYTDGSTKNKLAYQGGKNYAHLKAIGMAEDMYNVIDKDAQSLKNIHAVLDPEVYKGEPEDGLQYNDLSDPEKKLYDTIRTSNDFIHEWYHDQGLISDETYKKNKGQYIARLYEQYELTPPDVEQQFSKSRADFNMLKQRKDFSDVESEILKDPVFATAKRMSQMLQTQALFDYSDSVNKSKTIKVSDTEFPNSTQLGKPGDRPFYGSLTGKFVTNYIAEDFKGYFFANKLVESAYQLFRRYDKTTIRQFLKKSHTVYNPIVQIGNFFSNFSFAFWSGIDPITYSMNIPKAVKEIKTKGPYFQELVKNGIIGFDLVTQDLVQNKGGNVLSGASDKASKLYQGTDDAAKLSAYISLRESYGYKQEEALQMVYEGFQNYATVGKLYDFASKTPLVGNPYIKFKADLARILKNGITRRPLTAAAYLGLYIVMKDMLSEASGEDEDLKKARERRPFTPKIKIPGGGEISMMWQTPIGEVNFARFLSPYYVYDMGDKDDPMADATAWLPYQMKLTPSGLSKDVNTPSFETADVLLGPWFQAIVADRDFRGKSIRDPKGNKFVTVETDIDGQIVNALNYIARSQVPMFKSGQDLVSAYNGEADYYDRERTISQAILNNIIKVQDFGKDQAIDQLEKEIKYKVSKFESYTRDIAQLRSQTKKEIIKIVESSMPEDRKQIKIKSEVEKLNKRILDKIQQQVDVVKELEEPSELLKTLN